MIGEETRSVIIRFIIWDSKMSQHRIHWSVGEEFFEVNFFFSRASSVLKVYMREPTVTVALLCLCKNAFISTVRKLSLETQKVYKGHF